MRNVQLRLAGALSAALLAAACGKVFTVPLDSESRDFYDTARLVMTKAEDEIFRRLPDTGSRREFIDDFWEKRDPDPDTPENEFRDEFNRRLDYINKRFMEGRRGIGTDRGRIYFLLGPPEEEKFYPSMTGISTIWWSYYTYRLTVQFTETQTGTGYEITRVIGDMFRAFETAKLSGFGLIPGESQRLRSFTATYDRGRMEIIVEIPVKKVNFREESGVLLADFDFIIYIYNQSGGPKHKFEERRAFQGPALEVEKSKYLTFVFPYELLKGRNYADIIISGPDNGRTRKIFTFKKS